MSGLKLLALKIALLEPVTLHIHKAEIVCLSGPSGCGKSLLLRAIADLDVHEGEAQLDGLACQSLAAPVWRAKVGLLSAESAWWHERVDAHFARKPKGLLAALNLPSEALEWSVYRLSSGEKQRLAIARLLNLQPQALLLDEPSANLDVENTRKVEDLIVRFKTQYRAPVLWISHDDAQIRRVADRHMHISAGHLHEQH